MFVSEFEMEKEAMSEATSEDHSELVTVVHVTFSEQEPAREPHIAEQPATKKVSFVACLLMLVRASTFLLVKKMTKIKMGRNKYS